MADTVEKRLGRKWGCIALGILTFMVVVSGCLLGSLVAAGLAYYLSRPRESVEISAAGVMALDVGTPAALTVVNPSGDVTVEALAVERVQVRVNKVARSINEIWAERVLTQTQVEAAAVGPDAVQVEVVLPSRLLPGEAQVDLMVLVPRTVRVDVLAPRGQVRVLGIAADIRVQAGQGTVLLQDVAPPNEVEVTTRQGDIGFLGTLPAGRGWVVLRTRTGDIDVLLLPGASCELDAESRNGRVQSGFPLSGARSGRAGLGGEWLRGRINAGPAVDLVLRTGEGDVRIMPLP